MQRAEEKAFKKSAGKHQLESQARSKNAGHQLQIAAEQNKGI
jgi:hypothetical protein